jgi:hypothetical protein
MNDPFASSRRLGKVVLGAICLRILFSLGMKVMNPMFARGLRGSDAVRTFFQAQRGVGNLLTIIVIVLFMIWLRSEVVALRTTGAPIKTTPLMAILGWFIPFANFVLPLLSTRDVYKHRLPRSSGVLPIFWWLSYIALTISTVVSGFVPVPFPLGLVIVLTCFGLWFAMVFAVVSAPAVPHIAPSMVPLAYAPTQAQPVQPWPQR